MEVKYIDLAYTAGFLDGEGCFVLTDSITVKCAHTHKFTLEWLKENFGGEIREHNCSSHKKQAWVWSIHSKNAVNLLRQILPFLKEKKKKAELLLKYQETVGPRGKRVSDEVKYQRELIKKEFRL